MKGNSSLAWGAGMQEEQQMSRREGTKKVQDVEASKGHAEASMKRDSERVCGDEVGSKGDEKRIQTDEEAMGRKRGWTQTPTSVGHPH